MFLLLLYFSTSFRCTIKNFRKFSHDDVFRSSVTMAINMSSGWAKNTLYWITGAVKTLSDWIYHWKIKEFPKMDCTIFEDFDLLQTILVSTTWLKTPSIFLDLSFDPEMPWTFYNFCWRNSSNLSAASTKNTFQSQNIFFLNR